MSMLISQAAAADCLASKPEEEWLVADALTRLRHRTPGNQQDHRGERRGRLTVLCWSHARRRDNGVTVNYWLCRCVCGLYELRTGSTLKRNTQTDQCDQCNALERLRRRASTLAGGGAGR